MRKKNEAYRKFIQSAEWRAIKKRYRESLPWVCFICGRSESLELHHLTYARFGGDELLEDLRPLCHQHHSELHGRKTVVKRQEKSRALLRRHRMPGVKGVRFEVRDGVEYRILVLGDSTSRRRKPKKRRP